VAVPARQLRHIQGVQQIADVGQGFVKGVVDRASARAVGGGGKVRGGPIRPGVIRWPCRLTASGSLLPASRALDAGRGQVARSRLGVLRGACFELGTGVSVCVSHHTGLRAALRGRLTPGAFALIRQLDPKASKRLGREARELYSGYGESRTDERQRKQAGGRGGRPSRDAQAGKGGQILLGRGPASRRRSNRRTGDAVG
jgi:hypothetical protein